MQTKRINQWAARVLPMVAVVGLLGGCGASIGRVKTSAVDEIEQMSGLSASMKEEASWRIESLGDKQSVDRYLEKVRAESEATLAGLDAHSLSVDSWVDVPLEVVTSKSVDVSEGETLTLVGDGSVEVTPGLAELVDVSFWERVDQPLEDVRLCKGSNCQWHLRLLPNTAAQDVALERGFSGGPAIYLDVTER